MRTFKIFLAFVLGTGAGWLAGILTAPRSGKRTRKKIVNEVDSTRKSLEDTASQKLQEAKDYLTDAVEKPLEKSKDVIDKVKKTVHVN